MRNLRVISHFYLGERIKYLSGSHLSLSGSHSSSLSLSAIHQKRIRTFASRPCTAGLSITMQIQTPPAQMWQWEPEALPLKRGCYWIHVLLFNREQLPKPSFEVVHIVLASSNKQSSHSIKAQIYWSNNNQLMLPFQNNVFLKCSSCHSLCSLYETPTFPFKGDETKLAVYYVMVVNEDIPKGAVSVSRVVMNYRRNHCYWHTVTYHLILLVEGANGIHCSNVGRVMV